MVLPEIEESRTAVKFCFNLGYSATETDNSMQRAQQSGVNASRMADQT